MTLCVHFLLSMLAESEPGIGLTALFLAVQADNHEVVDVLLEVTIIISSTV